MTKGVGKYNMALKPLGLLPVEDKLMTNRSRAWRRRKARLILGKIQGTKNWIINQFDESKAKPRSAVKPRKAVKAQKAQDLRRAWQLNEDLVDGATG
jgi:hypothetical protein